MKNILRVSVIPIMISALGLAVIPVAAQSIEAKSAAPATANLPVFSRLDFGVTYAAKFIKVENTDGLSQMINGISADGVYNFGGKFKNFGLAADIDYESADAIKPGVNLKQFTVVAGPRYTVKSKIGARVYAQSLFGYVHAFNSVFPSGQSVTSAAGSFAMQLGGGVGVPLTKTFGLRIAEVDYIGTWLPNNNSNSQSDIRVSTGITLHF
jgi:hypothetical protein